MDIPNTRYRSPVSPGMKRHCIHRFVTLFLWIIVFSWIMSDIRKQQLNAERSKRESLDVLESQRNKKRLTQAKYREKISDSENKKTRLKNAEGHRKKRDAMTPGQLEVKRLKDAEDHRKKRDAMTPG